MKILYCVLIIMILILGLSACMISRNSAASAHEQSGILGSFNPEKNEQLADEYLKQVVTACQFQDEEKLASLFAPSAIQDPSGFSKCAAQLFVFCDGALVSYNDWAGPNIESKHYNSHEVTILKGTYDVTTEKKELRFAIKICSLDTEFPENIGIQSLYVILAENSDMQFAYWGDGKWKNGIIIEE